MGIDVTLFRFFNSNCQDAILDLLMPLITELGDGKFLFGLGLAMLIFKRERIKMTGILVMAGLTFSYNACYLLKNIIARPRPYITLEEVNVIFTTSGYSFPSTHATMAFASAFILARCFEKKRHIFYFVAVIIAISRVYLGVHFPSDVFVGGGLGLLIGHILTHIAELGGIYSPEKEL